MLSTSPPISSTCVRRKFKSESSKLCIVDPSGGVRSQESGVRRKRRRTSFYSDS
jgi:hypothetical protein